MSPVCSAFLPHSPLERFSVPGILSHSFSEIDSASSSDHRASTGFARRDRALSNQSLDDPSLPNGRFRARPDFTRTRVQGSSHVRSFNRSRN